jgi:hypothetical protein
VADGEIAVQARLHPSTSSWVTIPIVLSGLYSLSMVLDTGAPASAISPETATELQRFNLLTSPSSPPYHHRLTAITTPEGHPLPAFDVVVLPRLARMKAAGIEVVGLLGLNFLNQFSSVCYYVDTRTLVLQPRASSHPTP